MLWAIQTKMMYKPHEAQILNVLKVLGYDYCSFFIAPFSNELPAIGTEKTLFYGSTTVINSIYESQKWIPGAFFNENFDYRVWYNKYESLNAECLFVKLGEITEEHFCGRSHAFIRPVLDLKEFAGSVIKWEDFNNWKQSLINANMLMDCTCIVAEPCGLSHEWRVFIVYGQAISASQYCTSHRFNVSAEVPRDVLQFAEQQAKIFSPHDIFVMDIGQSNDLYYVIEVGCFNSSGFYQCDIAAIFKAMQEMCEKKMSPQY